MNTFDKELKIDRYLSGEMTEDERRDFENQLANDPDLREELRIQRLAYEALQKYPQSLKARMNNEGRQRLLRKKRTGQIAIVALIAIVCLAAWFLYKKFQPTPPPPVQSQSPIALFEQNYQRVDLSNHLGDGTADAWEEARTAYQQGNCEKALPLLEPFSADSVFTARPTALLLLGSCYLETGRTAEALAAFEAIPTTAGPVYRKSIWYSALAHLKNNDPFQAIPFLEMAKADPESEYQDRARLLLESLPVAREKNAVDSLKKK